MKMLIEPNNVVTRSISIEDFFLQWLESIQYLHKLTNKEMSIVAILLKKRFDLAKVVKDSNILEELLFRRQTFEEIRKRLDITPNALSVHMQHIKDKGIIAEGKIVPKWIPNITGDTFILITMLKINDFDKNSEDSTTED